MCLEEAGSERGAARVGKGKRGGAGAISKHLPNIYNVLGAAFRP